MYVAIRDVSQAFDSMDGEITRQDHLTSATIHNNKNTEHHSQ